MTKAQKLQREIARRNRVFQAATKAEKRVLIAADVIDQIKTKRLKARSLAWIIPESLDRFQASFEAERINSSAVYGADASVQQLFLSKKMEPCNCCALGGLFMSCTLYNNKTTVRELDAARLDLGSRIFDPGVPRPSNGLTTFFSAQQLQLIELAFEGGYGFFDDTDTDTYTYDDVLDKAHDFYLAHEDDEKRLLAIMRNIIKNKGKFVP